MNSKPSLVSKSDSKPQNGLNQVIMKSMKNEIKLENHFHLSSGKWQHTSNIYLLELV